jgi:hypothetical protein
MMIPEVCRPRLPVKLGALMTDRFNASLRYGFPTTYLSLYGATAVWNLERQSGIIDLLFEPSFVAPVFLSVSLSASAGT